MFLKLITQRADNVKYAMGFLQNLSMQFLLGDFLRSFLALSAVVWCCAVDVLWAECCWPPGDAPQCSVT